jgi:hypothetical protein
MLDLAISIDTDSGNTTIIETNHGLALKAPEWPHDCDFQLVVFDGSGDRCEVVSAEGLAEDIGKALIMLNRIAAFKGRRPAWYRRLERYATQAPLS